MKASNPNQQQGGRRRNRGKKDKANEAQTGASANPTTPAASTPPASTPAASTSSQSANQALEFASQASAPSSLCSQISDWNADTGATSHMTPHLDWFSTYTPHRVPIRLANDCVVYSAGIGTVHFDPVLGGKSAKPLSFTDVLHAPHLRSNLLSVLYLMHNKGLSVTIRKGTMQFFKKRTLLFTAEVST